MFPSNQGSELSFQAAAESYNQDLIIDNELLAAVNLYTTTSSSTELAQATPATADKGKARARGRKAGGGGGAGVSQENDDMRRTAHRDIERQRRNEMSTLFSDLRSYLPLDYLKGKRSMSEQIAESVNYIKQLEGRIKDLGERREQLRESVVIRDKLGGTSTAIAAAIKHACNVEVFNLSNEGGIQVQISGGDGHISRPLKVLVEAGLDVVSCHSNHANGILLHNIHCLQLQPQPQPQVTEMERNADIDVQQLQHRLYQVAVGSGTS